MDNDINIITACDSYKLTHWNMLPEGTENVYSYFESRTGARYNNTVFFGLQYYLKKYLAGHVVTRDKIEEAAELVNQHIGPGHFNRAMWEHILQAYDGRLPVYIKAVPEGTPIPVSNVLMTVQNTDPRCAALTNHLETLLSQVWAGSTVATLSYEIHKLIAHYRDETGSRQGLKFTLHDFGFRGTSSVESAGVLGAAHLVNFLGTDTIPAIKVAQQYYGAPLEGLAYSVPATEHSIMTSVGRSGEAQVFGDLLKRYPTGILSVVIDSYDYKNFVNVIAAQYRDVILAREGKVVFRPDSGEPSSVTMEVFDALAQVFGTTVNAKGYVELNPKVGVLWGDGIDYGGIRSILFTLRNNRYCTDAIVFGMGGGLLQKINRDDQRFAFKASAMVRNGTLHEIYKQPLDSSKASKRGILRLERSHDGQYRTLPVTDFEFFGFDPSPIDVLEEVFANGRLLREHTFADVRKNVGTW